MQRTYLAWRSVGLERTYLAWRSVGLGRTYLAWRSVGLKRTDPARRFVRLQRAHLARGTVRLKRTNLARRLRRSDRTQWPSRNGRLHLHGRIGCFLYIGTNLLRCCSRAYRRRHHGLHRAHRERRLHRGHHLLALIGKHIGRNVRTCLLGHHRTGRRCDDLRRERRSWSFDGWMIHIRNVRLRFGL